MVINTSSGCNNSGVKTISVSPTPTLSIASTNATLCEGGFTTLTALSGASTYSWNNGSSSSVISVTPNVTSTYSVVVTNPLSGCINNGSVTISVSPTPTLSIASTNTTLCEGSSATLTALSGANTYSWSNGNTNSTISVTPSVTSTYSVMATDPLSGCNKSGTETIYVNPSPTLSVFSNYSLVCAGETTTLTISGANSYTWSTGNNGSAIVVTPSITMVYSVTGIDINNCEGSAIFTQSVSICDHMIEMITIAEKILVYPNPFHERIWILYSGKCNIELFDPLGNCIGKISGNDRVQEINLSHQPAGIYLIKTGSLIKKIIKE